MEIAALAVAVLICVAPVLFGLIVAQWDKAWSRPADRRGPLV